ncbi:hypothetical protein ACFL3D_05595 [Candidatus Omnitrophota bacterium]
MKNTQRKSFSVFFIIICLLTATGWAGVITTLVRRYQRTMIKYSYLRSIATNAHHIKVIANFIKKNRKYGKNITAKELCHQIDSIVGRHVGEPPRLPFSLPHKEPLKELIINRLNIGFLLEDIDKKALDITYNSVEQTGAYEEQQITIHDEDVGDLELLLLVPTNNIKQTYPVVIAFHGHCLNSYETAGDLMAEDLVQNGFIVAIPRFKHMEYGWDESFVSIMLLRTGFHLLGMRVYESLLTLKFVEQLKVADQNRIGTLANSGGNLPASVIGLLTDRITCQVKDHKIGFMNVGLPEKGVSTIIKSFSFLSSLQYKYILWNSRIHCQCIPDLCPYELEIDDVATYPYPILEVEYRFEKKTTRAEIVDFFKMHLMDSVNNEESSERNGDTK